MARNALMPQMQLYEDQPGPELSNFTNPLMKGLQSYSQGIEKQFEGDRALAKEKLAFKADARADEDQRFQREQRLTQELGAMAQVVSDDPDHARAASNWGRLNQSMPALREKLASIGIDSNDHLAGSAFVAAVAGKYMSPQDRALKAANLAHVQKQTDVTRATLAQLKSQTPEYRAKVAEQYGLKKGTTAYDTFVISGQYSPDTAKFQVIPDGASVLRQNQRSGEAEIYLGTPKVDSTSKKAIFEAQDELPNLKAAVDQLNEAKGLVDSIYTGFGSEARSNFNQGASDMLPNLITNPDRAKATQRYNQIMGAESIGAMSQTLKGATTDFEMRQFRALMNDPNQSSETKKKSLDVMIRKAQGYHQNKVDRIRELGGRMPGETPGAAGPAADPLGIR